MELNTKAKASIKRTVEHWRGGKLLSVDVAEYDLLVNAGLNYLCEVVGNPTQPARMGYTAIGTGGATLPGAGQTALVTETHRLANTYTKLADVGKATLEATFTFTAAYAINECGLFNAATAGTMYCRDTFTVRNVESGDELKVKYTLTFTAA